MKKLAWKISDGRHLASTPYFQYDVTGGDATFRTKKAGEFWTDSNSSPEEAMKACQIHHDAFCEAVEDARKKDSK